MQKSLPHYRLGFFDRLRSRLDESGVSLRLLVGESDRVAVASKDAGFLPWAEVIHNRYVEVGRHQLIWQPCLRRTRSSDLVIVEQASKLLVNYPLLVLRRFGGPKVAWWGHGINLDPDAASPFAEAVKRKLAAQADWWFCYTQGTADLVTSLGVPHDRTTIVQNAIDTEGLRKMRSARTTDQVNELRRSLGIGVGPVAVFIGSLYPAKRPSFLIEAADRVRQQLHGFELIVIGNGPDRPLLDDASRTRPWLHVVGAKREGELALYAAPGLILLNPGVVGLAVLDGFALGLPMVTCQIAGHGPEIEYLEDGINGMILPPGTNAREYASEVAGLLLDSKRLHRLSSGADKTAHGYTLQEMVQRFAQGIRGAVGMSV